MKRLIIAALLSSWISTACGQETNWFLPGPGISVHVEVKEADGSVTMLQRGTQPFRFGIYIGPTNAAESALELVCVFTNSVLNPATFLPPRGKLSFAHSNYPPSILVAIQVRAWSLELGPSYEEALRNDAARTGYFGQTPVQTTQLIGPPAPAPLLFGQRGAVFKNLVIKRRSP